MEFIFNQSEDSNFENFLGEHAPTYPVNGLGFRVEVNLTLVKSLKSQGISSLLESGSPVKIHLWLKEDDHLRENELQHSLKCIHPVFRISGLLQAAFKIFRLLKVLHLCSGSSRSKCFRSNLGPLK